MFKSSFMKIGQRIQRQFRVGTYRGYFILIMNLFPFRK